ncbi:MAG: flagellar biosynthetic protein FliQ, partial [Kiritimatiellae bacterium]|nr:flagellar biosynthetic protein FliQ [Kiritimatiellia bacterium]
LTQIQEQTLGFAVKLIAISLTLLVCASWLGSTFLLYTQDIFSHFALLR